MMKRKYFIALLFVFSRLNSNPIDNTPVANFSELVFTDAAHWTLELAFPFEYQSIIDSMIISASSGEAKINAAFNLGAVIGIVTSYGLVTPLTINRHGDIIKLFTYSNINGKRIRVDELIFGNHQDAAVGAPVDGYSIMRNYWWDEHHNPLQVDCLTKSPSLGAVNDTLGTSATLNGNIYDTNNQPVTRLKVLPASPSRFYVHTALSIDSLGGYKTKVFRKFPTETIDHLTVRLDDFVGWLDSVSVKPFELDNIHPDTIVTRDIHLLDDEYVLTNIREHEPSSSAEIKVINYPNPSNASTHFLVTFSDLIVSEVSINIYNAKGQLVQRIPFSGNSKLTWKGTNMNGLILPSGIYYYRVTLKNLIVKSGSLILLK